MKKFTNFVGLDVHKETIAVITGSWLKDPADPQWADDQAVQAYRAFMKKYYPEGDPVDVFNVNGYSMSQAITEVLRRCKDDLTSVVSLK